MEVSQNGGTRNGWFIMENPILKLMILGSPHFRKPPYLHKELNVCRDAAITPPAMLAKPAVMT
jgi:hypothetical protein